MQFSILLLPQLFIIRNAMLIIPTRQVNPVVPIRYIKDIETLKDFTRYIKVHWKFLMNILQFLRCYMNIQILLIK